jgi:hypothetical protein
MTRRIPFLVFVFVCAYRSEIPASSGLDETIAGWHRTSLANLVAPSSLDPVPVKAICRAWRGSYQGSSVLDVRVYQLKGPLTLALVQRLRPPDDTAYYYLDHVYFVAIQWHDVDPKSIQDFVRDLEKTLSAR